MTDFNAQDPNRGPRQAGTQQPAPGAPFSLHQDVQWASLAHLGGILGVLPSLIIWLVFKDRGRFTDTEAKEALNFQITLIFGYIALSFLVGFITVVTFGLGSFLSILLWGLWIVSVVFSVLGYVRAKDGQHYRYPFAIRLIK